MTAADPSGASGFRYDAIGRDGRLVSDVVQAEDETAALRRLSGDGLVVVRLAPVRAKAKSSRRRQLGFGERVMVLRQLALMLNAGVPLLEALETVRDGAGAAGGQFGDIAAALKRGEAFTSAWSAHATGFPFYVHALAGVGEASGRLGAVLADAAEQMEFEHRLRRDLVNALTYPAFLACAGVAAVAFILIEIVPRFSAMLGSNTVKLPLSSRLLLRAGDFASSHVWAVALGFGGAILAAWAALRRPDVQQGLYALGRRSPILGRLLKAREIALWSRLTAFGLRHGVELLTSAGLARRAMPAGPLRTGLEAFETDLKAGRAVDEALARNTDLSGMDLSLLRAGQRSGALPAMFGALADKYEAELKDGVKRLLALLEPIAIGAIALMVGAVALSLVGALASLYDTVG